MNHTRSALLLSLVVFCLWAGGGFQTVAHAEESNPALKYHAILKNRPDPGYLFDRFYNAWLDRSTTESLEAFLQEQVKEGNTTADRLLLAFFHTKQNNDLAAIEAFREALERDASSALVWFHKAMAEKRTLDFEAAIADLTQAQKQKPDAKLAVRIQRQLGTMLVRNHQSEKAIAVWKTLLEANPGDEELCEDIIELHLEEGLYEPAIALSEALIARTKDPYQAVTRRLRLGDIRNRAGQREKSIEVYTSTLKEAGHDSWLEREILAQVDQIFRRDDNLSGLKEQYNTLLKAYPKRIALQRRRCRLLVELGEKEKAIEGYRKILELTPGDRGNREEYVDMLSQLEKHELAVKELDLLCKQHPKDAELQVKRAKTLHLAKESEKAIQAVGQYLDISDQTEYAYLRAARMVEQFGDKEKAKPFYRKMAETFPDSFSAQNVYATYLYMGEKKEDAIAIWKKLAKDIDVGLTLNLTRSLGSLGENKLAMELLLARKKDFEKEPLFLGQLVTTALRLKKQEEAIPWAKQRVELSTTETDLENAVFQAVAVCKQCDKQEKIIAELEATEARSTPLTCLLAELLESTGQSQKADQVLQKLVDANDPLALGQRVRLYCARYEWEKAAKATVQLLELSGGRKSLYVRRLVELYERNFQLDEALKWVETWKQLSPGSTLPWLTQARLLQIQGQGEEAQTALRKAIQRFDKDEDLRAQLAQSYARSGKVSDAERMYWQLYEKDDDPADKLRWVGELARLAEQDGNVSALVDNFKQRHRNNRKSIVPLLALSEIYRVADNYEGRRQALLDAAKIKSDDLQLLSHIARIEESEGNWNEAIATLQRAAKLDKTDKTQRKIAQLHLMYGDIDKGYAMLRELIDEQTVDPRDLERMVGSFCAMSEWEQGAEFLCKRISSYPQDYRLHYLLGVIYEELGRTEEAVAQFTSLLAHQEELPTVKKQGTQNVSHYQEIYKSLLPAKAKEWLELTQTYYRAYRYRQQRHGMTSYASYAMVRSVQTFINPPPSAESVRAYALTHLLTLAETMDDAQQASLLSDLESHGVYRPAILLEARLHREGNNSILRISELIKQFPEEEPLLALAVMRGMHNLQTANADYLPNAFKIFREKKPQLAIMAGIQAAAKDKEHAALLDESLKMAATVEQPNPLVVMSMVTTLGGQPWRNNANATEFTKEQRQKLTKLLLKWYPQVSKNKYSPYGSHFFYYVASALAQGEDPATFFALMEDEVVKWRKAGGKAKQSSMYISRQRNAQLLIPLGFPPPELLEFPPQVLTMLQANSNNHFARAMVNQNVEVWESAKVEPFVKKVKDPTLRLLLAQRYELPKIVEADLATILAAKTPRLDAYLLAAGKASVDEDWEKSAQLLEKSRHLPIKRDMRRRIDAAIVANVLAVKESKGKKEDLSETLLKIGRDAALRLRRQRLNQQERDQLVVAMEEFGLKKEAEKLENRAVASNRAGVVHGGYIAASPSSSRDRIKALIDAGKRDAAAHLLVGEIRSLGMQMMANPNNAHYYLYRGRSLQRRIQNYGLEKEVLALVKPGESKSPIRLQEYALTCEVLQKKSDARKAYEEVLKIRFRDDMMRMRLIMLLGKDEKAAIREHLEKISDSAANALGGMLRSSVDYHEFSWEERLHFVEMALEALKVFKERPRADVSWASSLLHPLGRSHYDNTLGQQLPSLYERRSANADLLKMVTKKMQERRLEHHRKFCLAMIDIPELGPEGFRHLLAVAEARGDTLWRTPADAEAKVPEKTETKEEGEGEKEKADAKESTEKQPDSLPPIPPEVLARYAEGVLLAAADHRSRRSGTNQIHHHYSSSSSEVRFRSPEEYLVIQAWKSKDWKYLDETLLPKLAEARNKQIHKSISHWVELYRCPSEQFMEVAKRVTKEMDRAVLPGQNANPIGRIVSVWNERALDIDIEPIILDKFEENAKSNSYSHHNLHNLKCCFETLIKRGKGDKVRQIFEKLGTIYLGPKEKRSEFVGKNFQQHMIQHGTPNAKIHQYMNIMGQFCQSDVLIFQVLSEVEPISEHLSQTNIRHQGDSSLSKRFRGKKAEEILAAYEESPWSADLERFCLLPVGKSTKDWPLVRMYHRHDFPDAKWKQARDLIEKKQKDHPTFGQGFFLALMAQKEQKTALRDYLRENLEAIQKLPARRQNQLALFAKAIVPTYVLKERSDSQNEVFSQWVDMQIGNQSDQVVKKVLQAKRLQDLGIGHPYIWEVGRYLSEVLPDLMYDDPAAATKVFLKVDEICQKESRRGRMNYDQNHNGQSHTGQLLERVMQQCGYNMGPELFPFLIKVAHSPQAKKVIYDRSVNYPMHRSYVNLFNECQKEGDKKLSVVETIPRFYAKLGKTLDGHPTIFLVNNLIQVLKQHVKEDKDYQKIIDWAKQELSNAKYPELAEDILACAQLCQEKKRNQKRVNSGDATRKRYEMNNYFNYFKKRIADDKQPLPLRMRISRVLDNDFLPYLPLELNLAITQMYVKLLEEEVPISGGAHRAFLVAMAPVLKMPNAKELISQWREHFAKQYLKSTSIVVGRNQIPPKTLRLINKPADLAALYFLLSVYLAADDMNRVDLILRKYGATISRSPLILAEMVRYGKEDHAARLFGKCKKTLTFDWPENGSGCYGKNIHKHTPKFIAKLSEEADRYAAKVLLATMPDLKRKEGEQDTTLPFPDRDARLAELAKQISHFKFESPALKVKLIEAMLISPAAQKVLAQELQGDYEKIEFSEDLAGNPSLITESEPVLVCYTMTRAKLGNLEPFIETLEKLAQPRPKYDDLFQKLMIPVLKKHGELLCKGEIKWTPEQSKAVAKILREAAKPKQSGTNCQTYNTMLLVSHVWSGQKDEFLKWFGALPEKLRTELSTSGIDSSIWEYKCATVEINDETLSERLAFVEDVLDICLKNQWFIWEPAPNRCYRMRNDGATAFRRIEKTKLFTFEETLLHLPNLAEKLDDEGLAKASLGIWLYGKGKHEQAAALLESAVGAVLKDDLQQVHYWRWGLARSLDPLRKYEEAKEVLAKIDLQKIQDRSTKVQIQRLKGRVESHIAQSSK